MYNNNQVHVNILTSKKSGVLSSIMLNGRKAGLMFQNKKAADVDSNQQRLNVLFEGNLNCSVNDFIQLIESHPEVISVESVSNEETNTPVIEILNEEAQERKAFNPNDSVNDKVLAVVEERLSFSLGPIAPLLVNSAKNSCFTAGELIKSLAQELKGKEKEDFLALADLKNTDYHTTESLKSNNANQSNQSGSQKTKASADKATISANSQNVNKSVKLFSHATITPESIQIAENKLSKYLGPVAPLLVQSAAERTKHVGDLFLVLAEELDGDEKREFLKIVNGAIVDEKALA